MGYESTAVIQRENIQRDKITQIKQHEYHEDELPDPVGWRMLIEPIDIEERTAGGIIMAEESKEAKEWNRYVGKVLKQGPDCYDPDKFKAPWCNVGDWVVYNKHSGMSIVVRDKAGQKVKLRIINDDSITTTTRNPRSLEIEI